MHPAARGGVNVAYQILCPCGRILRGERQIRHQVLPCPACGRAVFVLPRSPFEEIAPPAPARLPTSPVWRSWQGPFVAAVLCLVLLLVGFSVALPYVIRRPPVADESPRSDPDVVHGRMEAGRLALGTGKFHVARKHLEAALAEGERQPHLLEPARHRRLKQLHRQADLLARLLARPLEDVVRHARLVRDPDEWNGQFASYRGRTIFLDDVVRRDSEGRPVLASHVLEVEDRAIRVALEDLVILRDLPLEDGQRMLFGARLAGCNREEGGQWVIRLDPDSGVLLTDPGAVEACWPGPLDQPTRAVLERQQNWLDERASGSRARP